MCLSPRAPVAPATRSAGHGQPLGLSSHSCPAAGSRQTLGSGPTWWLHGDGSAQGWPPPGTAQPDIALLLANLDAVALALILTTLCAPQRKRALPGRSTRPADTQGAPPRCCQGQAQPPAFSGATRGTGSSQGLSVGPTPQHCRPTPAGLCSFSGLSPDLSTQERFPQAHYALQASPRLRVSKACSGPSGTWQRSRW